MATLEVAVKLDLLCTGQEGSRTWDTRLIIACGSPSEAVTSTSTMVVSLISLTRLSLGLGASASLMSGELISKSYHACLATGKQIEQEFAVSKGLQDGKNKVSEASKAL